MILSVTTKHFAEASFCNHSKFFRLLQVHEISIFPRVKSEQTPLFLCTSHRCSTSCTSLSRTQISSGWYFTPVNPFWAFCWVPPCTPPGCVWGWAPRGRPSLCSLCVGKHKLCSQGLCAAERHQVCYYNSSTFSGLYFLGYFIFSDLVSHLYNTRSNKGLPIQEDWVFRCNICSRKNIH